MATQRMSVKRIATIVAVFVFILLLTKLANQVPPPPPPGTTFSLKGQRVIQCSKDEITFVDRHNDSTHLVKDESWPDCSTMRPDEWKDYYLSRGEKTKYLSSEETAWWRNAL